MTTIADRKAKERYSHWTRLNSALEGELAPNAFDFTTCWKCEGGRTAGKVTTTTCQLMALPVRAEAVDRGGSWLGILKDLRAAQRSRGKPIGRFNSQGFRLARIIGSRSGGSLNPPQR